MEKETKIIFGAVVGMVTMVIALAYYTGCRQASIYNRINGTSFTCSDFFWAAEQINIQTQTIKLK